jgi:hypothetical protein
MQVTRRFNLKEYRILENRILKYRLSKLNIRHISPNEGWGKFFNIPPTKFDRLLKLDLYPKYTIKQYLEAFSKPE